MFATISRVKIRPNTIVQYKGGGYDGCIWEWNYAYLDSQGEFHCIVATGYRGCRTFGELRDFLATTEYDLSVLSRSEDHLRTEKTDDCGDHGFSNTRNSWYGNRSDRSSFSMNPASRQRRATSFFGTLISSGGPSGSSPSRKSMRTSFAPLRI